MGIQGLLKVSEQVLICSEPSLRVYGDPRGGTAEEAWVRAVMVQDRGDGVGMARRGPGEAGGHEQPWLWQG